jgi:hypothetical protein
MVYCTSTGSQYQVYMKWCLPALQTSWRHESAKYTLHIISAKQMPIKLAHIPRARPKEIASTRRKLAPPQLLLPARNGGREGAGVGAVAHAALFNKGTSGWWVYGRCPSSSILHLCPPSSMMPCFKHCFSAPRATQSQSQSQSYVLGRVRIQTERVGGAAPRPSPSVISLAWQALAAAGCAGLGTRLL